MRAYLWVSLGALVGANLRYFLSRLTAKLTTVDFPYGTLLINVTGSLILGIFPCLDDRTRPCRPQVAPAGGDRFLRLVYHVFQLCL